LIWAENQDKDPDVPKELFDNSREYPENNFHTFEDAPEEVFDNSREYSKYNFQAFEEDVPEEVFDSSREYPENNFQTPERSEATITLSFFFQKP